MPAAPGRFRLLLIVSALLAVAAALHAIRWKPMFELSYTGSRVLTVLDIVPLAPTLPANEDSEVCLVRTSS